MKKHNLPSITQEEWRLGEKSENPPNGIRIVDVQDVTIATCWQIPGDMPKQALANAILVKAAPDMLEALKFTLDQAGLDKQGNVWKIIQKAIAKAEGKK